MHGKGGVSGRGEAGGSRVLVSPAAEAVRDSHLTTLLVPAYLGQDQAREGGGVGGWV